MMHREADSRRHSGAVNGMTIVNLSSAALPPLNEGPEDYRDYWEKEAEREACIEPWANPSAEWKESGWFSVSTSKRVYSQNEKQEAVNLYRGGASASVVGGKFGAPAATIRTWARRNLLRDVNGQADRFTP